MLFRNNRKAVVIKRTPDKEPYKLLGLQNDTVIHTDDQGFVSPMYGDDNYDNAINNRVIDKPISQYEPFSLDGRIKKDEENPYFEFATIKGRDGKGKTQKEENKHQEETPTPTQTIDEIVNGENRVPLEDEVEPNKIIHYEDNVDEVKEIDKGMMEDLFHYTPSSVTREYNKDTKEETASSFDEEDSEPIRDEKPAKVEFIEKDNTEFDYSTYKYPPLSLLHEPVIMATNNIENVKHNCEVLNQTLRAFKIDGQVEEYTQGPTFTRYAIGLAPGVQGSKIDSLQTDIQRALRAISLRIQNPIPGKPYIGIEVPNEKRRAVNIKELLSTREYEDSSDPVLIPIGLDVEGKAIYSSISDWPHSLIAGATGSGKSVFINNMVASILFKATPEDVRFFFVDPKQVELQAYSNVPHLLCPIISDPKQGIPALKWLVDEMNRRYTLFREYGGVYKLKEWKEARKKDKSLENLPIIVCIIDEAADFLMTAGQEAVDAITLLVQKSRAAGIHITLAMQKPIASVLSSVIKSQATTRFAFKVVSRADSMVILDETGADELLNHGDMIYYRDGMQYRCQGAFVDKDEISLIVDWVIKHSGPQKFVFNPKNLEKNNDNQSSINIDEKFAEVARYVVRENRCSTNAICRQFHFSYNRADSIVLTMEQFHIVELNQGTKPREVLVDEYELEEILRKLGF